MLDEDPVKGTHAKNIQQIIKDSHSTSGLQYHRWCHKELNRGCGYATTLETENSLLRRFLTTQTMHANGQAKCMQSQEMYRNTDITELML